MAKNSIFDPTKDGVKADNSGYSSNQIDKMINQSAAALIDDDASGDDTVYSSAKIYSLLPEDTATGAEVTITDACPDLPIVAGTFNIDANLDGVTEVTISNDTEDVTVTLPDPCYGGTVQTDGTVNNTYYKHDVTSSDFLGGYSEGASVCTCYINLSTTGLPVSVSSGAVISNNFSTSIPSGTPGRMSNQGTIIYFAVDKTELSTLDLDGMKAWFDDHPTTIVYILATPEAGTSIDPFTIKTLPGVETTNSISCDTGDSSVTYKKLTTLS